MDLDLLPVCTRKAIAIRVRKQLEENRKLKLYADCKLNCNNHLHVAYHRVGLDAIMDTIIEMMDTHQQVMEFLYQSNWEKDVDKTASRIAEFMIEHFRPNS